MSYAEIAAIISFAFLGSLGHCVGMCGGFVISYTTAKIDPSQNKAKQSLYHFMYNIGRVSSYTLLGALFGYFGSLWDVGALERSIMLLVSGSLMILMGLSFAGKLKFLTYLEVPINKIPLFKKIYTFSLGSKSVSSFFTLGVLNGLIPCGLVYIMLVTSISTASALYGAFVMFVFGLFTMPTMFTLGFLLGQLNVSKYRKLMLNLASISVILFGSWTLFKAYKQYDYYVNTPKETLLKDKQEMKCGAGKCGAGKCGMGKCGSQE